MSQIAAKYGIHSQQVRDWRKYKYECVSYGLKYGVRLSDKEAKMKKIITLNLAFFILIVQILYATPPPANVPRITPQQIKYLISKGIKYIFIDSSVAGDSHICGATYISYTWFPPYGKERIKNIRIPKDYYIFCY